MKKKSKSSISLKPHFVGDLEKESKKRLTHIECLRSNKCQETEGFKGTKHEGLDMCEDGCVWFQPQKK